MTTRARNSVSWIFLTICAPVATLHFMEIFSRLGFSQKEEKIYLHLLKSGPASIRQIAADMGMGRGAVYEALKKLHARGLVRISGALQKKKFMAEDPDAISRILAAEEENLSGAKDEYLKALPMLESMHNATRELSAIKVYEGHAGTRTILEDVLKTVEKEKDKTYRVYSAANIREYLYISFASFSERRIKMKIKAKVIAIGAGGEIRGLDERRWITTKTGSPAYVIIYGNKTAIISLSQGRPYSVVVQDEGLAQTQKLVFDSLWEKLKSE